MGQTPSNPTIATPSLTRYSPKYHVIETKQDPHYGEVKIIIEDETNEKQILKEISFSSQEAFDKELDYFTQRVQVSHPNIVSILGFSSEHDNNKTPHSFTIKIFIEMLDKDLQQELQERIQAKQFYSESELLFICENIISALYHLESKGFSHGDIRSFNIFASSKGYKLFDPFLSSQNEQNALTTAIKSNLKVFLSPQLLAQVPEKDQAINCNRFKADVFSVGITMLSLASLTNGEDLYDYETGQINKELLQERLSRVKSHYSAFTYDLIRDMLIEEEAKRPDFKDLHTKLLPYQDNIHQKIDLPFFKTKENQALTNDKENMKGVNKENLFQGGEVKRDTLKGGDLKQGSVEGPIREFDYYYTRVFEKENVKMGGSHKGTEDVQLTKKGKKSKNKKRKNQNKEVIKTGSILINPDDVLPSQKENLHVDPKTGETYANLKPSGQIEEEQEGIVHAPEPKEVEKGQGEIQPTSGDIQSAEGQESGAREIELTRADEEEPLKTGGIVIRPEDALPSEKEHLHIDPQTGEAYALLKSGTQIKEEQAGIVHASDSQENHRNQEDKQAYENDSREIEYIRAEKEEPLKTGGIVIKPEDALPSQRENLHVDTQTGEAYALLKSGTQIREEQAGIVHAPEPQEQYKEQRAAQETTSKDFAYEYRIPNAEEDPLKTGGIVIRPEDALPSERDRLQADPNTGEAYVLLKSASQIKDEQGGIVHAPETYEEEKIDEIPSNDKFDLVPTEVDRDASRIYSRQFMYEYSRGIADQDPIKTGGIVINPDDALAMHRSEIQTDPRTHYSYARLKPWSQIQREQKGIVHQPPSHAFKKLEEFERLSKHKRAHEYQERMPESLEEVYIDRSQLEISHGYDGTKRARVTEQLEYQPSKPVEDQNIRIIQPTRFMYPEDMLPWARNGPQTMISEREEEPLYDIPQQPENEVFELRPPETNAPMISRASYYDYYRPSVQEEPIKTGGIIIRPDDALSTHRMDINNVRGISYAVLKPWTQIRAEQNGIVHNSVRPTIQRFKKEKEMPIFSEERKIEQDYVRETQSEALKESSKARARRPNVAQTQDKENISNVANYEKLTKQTDNLSKPQGFGLMSQSGNITESQENGKSGLYASDEPDYFDKELENRNKLTELDNKLDNILQRSRVILGESNVMNNLII